MKQLFPSGLRILTWAALCAAVITTSCKKDDTDNGGNGGEPTPPPVTLTDQIEYDGGDPIDIKSVVYEIDEEDSQLYTFYLSPTEGLQTVKQMENADDYLKLVVQKPHGEVNTASENFEIYYEDISISKLTLNTDVESIQLSTNLLEQSNQFVLFLDVEMKSGKTLLARYNNYSVQYKLPTLNNQYALDDEVKKIGSIVEWADLTAGTTTYYVYEAEGVTTTPTADTPAAMTIVLASDLDAEQIVNGRLAAGSTLKVDFSTADLTKVSIQCGEFQTAQGVTGQLTLKKDRNDDTRLTMEFDIEKSNVRLRADFDNNTIGVGYASTNHMTVTVNNEAVVDADLATIYRYDNQFGGGYQFALGVPDPNAEEPKEGLAGLTTGHFTVQFNISASQVGKTLDLADLADATEQSAPFIFYLYDNKTYTTYDPFKVSGRGATGTIRTIAVGTATYYVNVDVQIPNGPSVKAEWYGSFTRYDADMTGVLTPVMPYQPKLLIYTPDGELVNGDRTDIMRVELRRENGLKIRGGAEGEDAEKMQGATLDAYVFYVVRSEDDLFYADNDVENKTYFPQLMVPVSAVSTNANATIEEATIDLTQTTTVSNWWFKFTNSAFNTTSEFGENYVMNYGYPTNVVRCPKEMSISIIHDTGKKTWKFYVTMDSTLPGYDGSWATATQRNKLSIQWEGPMTKYSGDEPNVLDNSFYE